MKHTEVSDQLIEWFTHWEAGPTGGPALTAYWDKLGAVWTIGYGETEGVQQGDTMTEFQALDTLRDSAQKRVDMLNAPGVLTVDPSVQQFDALDAILYNVGKGRADTPTTRGRDGILVLRSGRPSSLIRTLNAGDYDGAAAHFIEWDMGGGEHVRGLTLRRKAEQAIWLRGDYSRRPGVDYGD